MKRLGLLIMLVLLSVALFGCGQADLLNKDGQLALYITDKPVNNVKSIMVTLDSVQISQDNENWQTINDFTDAGGELTVDLLNLRFDQELIGQESLEPGQYSQIRLIVAASEEGKNNKNGKSKVVYTDQTEEDIFIPSGTQTGLKIDHNFEIQPNIVSYLVMDVDVAKVLHSAGKSGNIILRPTAIKVIDEITTGEIKGRVVNDQGEAIIDADVKVEAIQNEEVIGSTTASTEVINDESAGTFLIRGLKPGDYTVKAYVVDGNGDPVSDYTEATTEELVPVSVGETTTLDSPLTISATSTQ